MKISVVVPCYNEADNIPPLLERFAAALDRDDIEVLLVDNGSTDTSAQVLRELAPAHPFLRVVPVKENKGYGHGVLCGLREARGEFLGWTHADLQTDPGDTIKALGIIESSGGGENVFVKGTRKGRPLFDNVFTMGMGVFETIFLGEPLWDINAQPNVFHRSFFEKWENPPHDFALDLYALYLASTFGLRVMRFPVVFPERVHGESKWNTGLGAKWKFIRRTVDFSVRLKHDIRHGIHSPQDKHRR